MKFALATVFIAILTLLSITSSEAGLHVGDVFPLDKLDALEKMPSQSGYSRSDVRNNPLVLVFWASWCPHCRKELPHINELAKSNVGRLTVVGICEDKDKYTPAGDASQLSFPQAFDAKGRLADAVGSQGLPSTYIIGRGSKILRIIRGYSPENVREITETFRNEPAP